MSPYTVRKALENTASPVGTLPEDKLTAGEGLMQVDKLRLLLSSCHCLLVRTIVRFFFNSWMVWQGL